MSLNPYDIQNDKQSWKSISSLYPVIRENHFQANSKKKTNVTLRAAK